MGKLVNYPTINPLDAKTILGYAVEVSVIVTVEEHTVIGGLGSAVAEIVAEASFSSAKRFKRIGIPDTFPDEYGSQDSLMERYSITIKNLASIITALVEQRREQLHVISETC